jgi:cytochrome P450
VSAGPQRTRAASIPEAAIASPADVDYRSPAFWQDPHPVLRAARERHPLARASIGYWLVLRHADVERLLQSPALRVPGSGILRAQGITEGPLAEWWPLILFNTNPPVHTRLRALLSRAFTPRRMEALRPRIREMAHAQIDRHCESGQLDWVADVAHELPVMAICELLDVPAEDWPRFIDASTDLALAFSLDMPPERLERVERALVALYTYVDGLLERRRARPGPDLLSALIAAEEAGDRLSTDELRALSVNLLLAGHDTTRSLLSIGAWLLAADPRALSHLRERPEGLPAAVEEILRFEPVAEGVAREAVETLELGGVRIEPGEPLFLSLLAANRDPAAFPDPDRFDPARAGERHLSFGRGLHFCLGAALARAEAQETLGVLLERLEDLEPEIERPVWQPFTANRRIEALPLRFRAHAPRRKASPARG